MDVSNPEAPSEISAYDTPGYAWDVSVSAGRAYVADGVNGLVVIDVSNPSVSVGIGHFLPEREQVEIRAVDVIGSLAFLAAGYSGFTIVDITDPGNPVEVGHHDTPRSARSVQVSGSYAYVGDLKWLRVFDVSAPSSPREIASYKIPADVTGIQVEGAKVYVAASESGFMILDTEVGRN